MKKRRWQPLHTPAEERIRSEMKKGALDGNGTKRRAIRAGLARRVIAGPNIVPMNDALFAGVKGQSWVWRDPPAGSSGLKARARRNGIKSIHGGDEPRSDELVAHYPQDKKRKTYRIKLDKRKAKRLRKDRLTKRAGNRAHKARLTAPWPIFIKEGEIKDSDLSS